MAKLLILLYFLPMDMTYHLNGGFKPTIKRFADLDGPDYFPTPAWATHALIDNERFTVKYQGLDQKLTGVEPAHVIKELLA